MLYLFFWDNEMSIFLYIAWSLYTLYSATEYRERGYDTLLILIHQKRYIKSSGPVRYESEKPCLPC